MWTPADEAQYNAALVRIYHGSRVSGCGILVAEQYVLTCAHVLARGETPPATIRLDFPFQAANQYLQGRVEYWHPERDIAGVRLLDPVPPGVVPLPLPASNRYVSGPFRVYGFPEKQPIGGWALGQIVGEATQDLVQIQGDTAQGYAIEPGFSGAPVWSEDAGGVIGLARLRDKDRPDAKIAYLIPYRQLIQALKAGQAVSLLALLEEAPDLPLESVEGAYRVCRPEGSLQPIPADLPDKVKALAGMKDQEGHSALVRFAVCLTLAEFPVPLAVKQTLREWLLRQEVAVEAVEKWLAPRLQAEQGQATETASPHLLIWLNAVNGADTYSVNARFIPDRAQYDARGAQGVESVPEIAPYEDIPIRLSHLPEVIRGCLADCRGLCSSAALAHLTIELFLPFSLLQESLEWEAAFEIDEDEDELGFLEDEDEPDPLAILHRFVVRCSDRLSKGYAKKGFRALWEQKWAQLRPMQHTACCDALVSVDDDTRLKQLRTDLDNPNRVGIWLLKCPTQVEGGNPLKELLKSGAPTAVWLRETLAQGDSDTALATLLGCGMGRLPEAIKQARKDAFPLEKDAHIGHHLSLVWEDPTLIPPVTDDLAS